LFSFIPITFIPGIVSIYLIFSFPYMCTLYVCCIHPLTPFPHILSPAAGPTPQDRTYLFHLSVLWFFKRKKMTFLFI
jgi:hypothetical protein